MTRINLVPPEELHPKHLVAEYREIVRVFALVRKREECGGNVNIPSTYCLGTGHVTFFYDKLGFVLDRYHLLAEEMRGRGFSPNPISDEELCRDISPKWFNSYTPTEEALRLNRERIQLRMPKNKGEFG